MEHAVIFDYPKVLDREVFNISELAPRHLASHAEATSDGLPGCVRFGAALQYGSLDHPVKCVARDAELLKAFKRFIRPVDLTEPAGWKSICHVSKRLHPSACAVKFFDRTKGVLKT
jgi:hypothetical protein